MWLIYVVHIVAGALGLVAGYIALYSAKGAVLHRRSGILFVYATLTVSDVRMMRAAPLKGASRLARHLWRMSFALFIAALSFFIGQAQVFPKPIRIMPMLALPVLAVLVTMLYWLWRVRVRPPSIPRRTPRPDVVSSTLAR